MLRTLLVVMCLVLGSGAVNAGWFGPDSEQECVRKYEHKIKDKLTKTMVLDGCSNLFTKGLKRVGKCKIENMDRVKSGDGLVLLEIGCVGM